MGVKITSLSGLAVSTAITPFLFIQILKTNYGVMGIFFLVRSLMTFFVQPLWLHLTYRYGNKFTFYLSSLIYGLANISFLFADAGEPTWAIYLRGFFIGVSAGGQLLIGQALLPETIAYDFQRTGLRREGIFAGVYTTVEKASFALAGAGMGILLGSMGYVESTGQLVAQSHSALMAINICVASPALFQFLSSLFLHHYHLDTPEPASTQEALRDAMAR
jgi:GPH family glycoside/pentoside/hexuronide:cation symporter